MDVAKDKLNGKTIEVATGMVNLFDSITPKEMAEFQRQDNQIAPIFTHVEQDQKPSKKVTYQIRSKLARKLALQWVRLILKQGVIHRLYIFNEMEYHQLVLPQRYHCKGTYGSSRPYGSSRHRANIGFTPRLGLLAIYAQGCSKLGY